MNNVLGADLSKGDTRKLMSYDQFAKIISDYKARIAKPDVSIGEFHLYNPTDCRMSEKQAITATKIEAKARSSYMHVTDQERKQMRKAFAEEYDRLLKISSKPYAYHKATELTFSRLTEYRIAVAKASAERSSSKVEG